MPDSFTHDETGAEIDSVFEEVAADAAMDAPSPAAGADPELDQVREILLGRQTRELEQRLTASQQQVDRAIAEMNAETTRRVEAVESTIKGELGKLIEMLGTQREERTSQYRELQESVEQLATETETKLAELTSRLDALEESTRTEIDTRALELSNEISAETAQLRDEVVERAALAALFETFSKQIAAKPVDAPAPTIPTGDDSEAMIDELLGGEGL